MFTSHPVTTATISGVQLPITAGTLTLDSAWSPYAQAEITVPLTDSAVLDRLEPFAKPRVKITASTGATLSTFDLVLRSREVSHDSKEIRLELASDEALLQGYAQITDDKTPRAYEANLRSLIDYVLTKTAGVDSNNEAYNNPRGVSTGGNEAFGSRYGWTLSYVTGVAAPISGLTTAARFTSQETGTVTGRGIDSYGNGDVATPGTSGIWTAGPRVFPGETITVSRYLRILNVTGTVQTRVSVRFHDGAGNWVGNILTGASTPASTAWHRPTWTGVVPAGAVYISISARQSNPLGVTTSSSMDITGLQIETAGAATAFRTTVLQPGTATADLTAQWDADNLFPNPNWHRGLAPWGLGANARDYAQSTSATPLEGSFVGRWYSVSAGVSYLDHPPITVREGRIYTVAGMMLSNQPRSARIMVRLRDAAGNTVRDVHGPLVTTSPSAWTRLSNTVTIPPGVTTVSVHIAHWSTAGGEFIFVDTFSFTEGPVLLPYFSGDTANTPAYTYTWSGDPGTSSSIRTANPERLPELFTWKAGISAWDFLEPLLAAAGLRLFCDEARRWYLVDPKTFEVAGRHSVRPDNTVRGDDTISVEQGLGGFSGVVVRYTWTDADGNPREQLDTAGTSGRVKTLTFDSPYPGPGAAQAHLNKLAGQGRTQNVTVQSDYTVRPAQEVSISLPATDDQVGRVTRVTFDLGPDSVMTVESGGLTEATPGSWLQGYSERTWSTTPDTATWANQT